MKLTGYFNQFLRDTVNLRQTRLDDLDSRVESITTALTNASGLKGRVVDTVPQGSWAHKTIIEPGPNLEFDADFLLQLTEEPAWADDPRQYANAVWDALSNHGTYGSMSSKKDRCVRVSYANDCHVDVVPYVVTSTGAERIINRKTNEFEDTNPVGFTDWLQAKDDITGGDLRRVLRLLKYLRDFRGAFSIKSVLLTTLAGNVVEAWFGGADDRYQDVPTTLVNLVEDLDAWLQARPTKPPICDPSCPTTSFDHRWNDTEYESFRSKIHDLAPRLREAYDTAGTAASVTAWQDIFGPSFPAALAAAALTGSTSTTAALPPKLRRAPKEQFVEDKFPVAIRNTVSITAEVSEPSYPNRKARRRALKSRRGWVPKHRTLWFKMVHTDVVGPYDVYWKVRNTGHEATVQNALRGEIVRDMGLRERTETSLYTGRHYVECYIVKDGVCVARSWAPVNIPPTS